MASLDTVDLSYSVGARLRRIRDALGLKSTEMAEHIGVSPFKYSNFETGKQVPTVDVLQEIEQYLREDGLPAGFLFAEQAIPMESGAEDSPWLPSIAATPEIFDNATLIAELSLRLGVEGQFYTPTAASEYVPDGEPATPEEVQAYLVDTEEPIGPGIQQGSDIIQGEVIEPDERLNLEFAADDPAQHQVTVEEAIAEQILPQDIAAIVEVGTPMPVTLFSNPTVEVSPTPQGGTTVTITFSQPGEVPAEAHEQSIAEVVFDTAPEALGFVQ